jgi:hypothetical protein
MGNAQVLQQGLELIQESVSIRLWFDWDGRSGRQSWWKPVAVVLPIGTKVSLFADCRLEDWSPDFDMVVVHDYLYVAEENVLVITTHFNSTSEDLPREFAKAMSDAGWNDNVPAMWVA